MNEYEIAVERLDVARRNLERAGRIFAACRAECDAAVADLARLESKPGIPLPEYRRRTSDQS